MPYTDSSGLSVAYDDMGEGSPTLLFLGGWCVNRTVFDDLAQRCAKRWRCLTLDWRGHGESERPVLDFGAAELVEDALAIIRASSAECVVPVALEHSGWVAVELRRKLGDHVPKIVLPDWLITGAPKPFVEALSGMQSENQWRATVDGIFKQWLHSTHNEKLIRRKPQVEQEEERVSHPE